MRILHMLAMLRMEYGGPVRAVLDLCGALAERNHEVTLATWDTHDAPPQWASPGLEPPPPLPAGEVPEAARAEGASAARHRHGMSLKPTLEKINPPARAALFSRDDRDRMAALIESHDLLHLHGVWNPWNWQLGAIARRLNKPYIISVRGMLDDWCMEQKPVKKRLFLAVAVRKWLERAAFVHLTAQAEHDQARKHFPRGRGIVISNLTDLKPFENLPGPELARAKFPVLADRGAGRPNLLFLSRVHVKKGLEVLLRAGALLRRRGIDTNILIAGTGDAPYVESLEQLAKELNLAERTYFLGLVVNEEKLSLYQAADLFVLPTSQENFGFVFIESLACATPVVTTRGVDIWPELEASGGAVIADPTPEATADAIATLLAKRDSLTEMGAKGREWVFRDMAPSKVIREFEEMYRRAVGG